MFRKKQNKFLDEINAYESRFADDAKTVSVHCEDGASVSALSTVLFFVGNENTEWKIKFEPGDTNLNGWEFMTNNDDISGGSGHIFPIRNTSRAEEAIVKFCKYKPNDPNQRYITEVNSMKTLNENPGLDSEFVPQIKCHGTCSITIGDGEAQEYYYIVMTKFGSMNIREYFNNLFDDSLKECKSDMEYVNEQFERYLEAHTDISEEVHNTYRKSLFC